MSTVYLIRGISGSGKTTLARAIYRGEQTTVMVAADDYFYEEGEYRFNPSDLPKAHAMCLDVASSALEEGACVIVHNTFTQRWEMEPYIKLAKDTGSRLVVLSTYDGGCTDEELAERNSHGVPLDAIRRMRERWEMDWKNGNPVPPWMR